MTSSSIPPKLILAMLFSFNKCKKEYLNFKAKVQCHIPKGCDKNSEIPRSLSQRSEDPANRGFGSFIKSLHDFISNS